MFCGAREFVDVARTIAFVARISRDLGRLTLSLLTRFPILVGKVLLSCENCRLTCDLFVMSHKNVFRRENMPFRKYICLSELCRPRKSVGCFSRVFLRDKKLFLLLSLVCDNLSTIFKTESSFLTKTVILASSKDFRGIFTIGRSRPPSKRELL